MQPATLVVLAAKHGIAFSEEEMRHRYSYRDFMEFIEAFKWVCSLLREPDDYALALRDLGEQLLAQHVAYAELTLSIGVMLLRKQSVENNFEAILEAAESFRARGLRLNFVFDAVRQFGAEAAMKVVEAAARCGCRSIVAFGIGGDELSVPAKDFRGVYDAAGELGLHRLMHAGEIGGAKEIWEAVEVLAVERIGHGIAAIHDPDLMDLLAELKIPLEICPGSNMRTGVLAKQLGVAEARIDQHPLPFLFRHGIPVMISTDDPAMFRTSLSEEYENAARMGLQEDEVTRIVKMSFEHAFAGAADEQSSPQRGNS